VRFCVRRLVSQEGKEREEEKERKEERPNTGDPTLEAAAKRRRTAIVWPSSATEEKKKGEKRIARIFPGEDNGICHHALLYHRGKGWEVLWIRFLFLERGEGREPPQGFARLHFSDRLTAEKKKKKKREKLSEFCCFSSGEEKGG